MGSERWLPGRRGPAPPRCAATSETHQRRTPARDPHQAGGFFPGCTRSNPLSESRGSCVLTNVTNPPPQRRAEKAHGPENPLGEPAQGGHAPSPNTSSRRSGPFHAPLASPVPKCRTSGVTACRLPRLASSAAGGGACGTAPCGCRVTGASPPPAERGPWDGGAAGRPPRLWRLRAKLLCTRVCDTAPVRTDPDSGHTCVERGRRRVRCVRTLTWEGPAAGPRSGPGFRPRRVLARTGCYRAGVVSSSRGAGGQALGFPQICRDGGSRCTQPASPSGCRRRPTGASRAPWFVIHSEKRGVRLLHGLPASSGVPDTSPW